MGAALHEAALAIEHGDVPVGAVVVHCRPGDIVARAHNARESETRSDRARRDPRPAGRRPARGHVAADRLRAGRHARAVPDVRGRGVGRRASAAAGVRRGRPEGRRRGKPLQLRGRPPAQPRDRCRGWCAGRRSAAICSPSSFDRDADSVDPVLSRLGGMRERPNRMVSKTIVAQVTVGSNPTPSAHTTGPTATVGPVRGVDFG